MRKYFISILVLAFGLCLTSQTAAAEDVSVPLYMNGDRIVANAGIEAAFINADNRTMLPLRLVNNYLGYETDWSPDGTIRVRTGQAGAEMIFQIGHQTYLRDGQKATLCSAPVLKDNRAYLPARDLAELTGSIIWRDGRVDIYPVKNYQVSYETGKDGRLYRLTGGQREALALPADTSVYPLRDFIAKQKVVDGKSYVLINFNHAHSGLGTLYRDDGDRMTKIADRINATSSFTLKEGYLYYTDGVSAGPWLTGIRPDRLYRLAYEKSASPEEIKMDFPVNQAILTRRGDEILALTPEGYRALDL